MLKTVQCFIHKERQHFPTSFIQGLCHGHGGWSAYLSPEVLCCREQLRQSQRRCIILVAWVHAQESWIPFPSSNYSPVFLTCLAFLLLAVSDKKSGKSKPALPDPPLHSESVGAGAVISFRACSFSKRERVCERLSPCVLFRHWPSSSMWPSRDAFTIYYTFRTTHNVSLLGLLLSLAARDQLFTWVCVILMSIQSRMATLINPTLKRLGKQPKGFFSLSLLCQ